MKKIFSGRIWISASFAIFAALLLSGWTWWDQQTEQTRNYALGRIAYTTASYDLAVEYFDLSFADYNERVRSQPGFFSAPGSLEMAALAQHFKALALIKMKNAKLAIVTFKEALMLTNDSALSGANLDPESLRKIRDDRKTTQIDFEILFNQQQQMAEQEGKGKGQGKPEDKQSEDPAKGNQPGKSDRDAL